MRFRYLAISLIAVSSFTHAADPRLQFDPAQPRQGQFVTVTFDPKGGPLEKSGSITLVYGWTPYQWLRTPMTRNGTRLSAQIMASAPYMWCWVEDPTSGARDTNHGTVWDTYFYDDNGIPLQGARQARAEMYQVRGQPNEKNDVALALLEEELRAFPSNAFARAEWWGLHFEEAGPGSQQEARDRIAHEISVFLDANSDKPWAYLAAIEGCQRIGRTAQGREVLHAFLKRFPGDNSLDNMILVYFQEFNDFPALEALPQVSKRWAANPRYWEFLFNAYRRPDVAPEKLRQTGGRWLESLKSESVNKGDPNYASVRIGIAEAWLAKGVDPTGAERLAREAVSTAESAEKFLPNSVPVPAITTQSVVTPVYRSTLGWALFKQQRYDDALRELDQAVAYGEKEHIKMRDVYYRLGQTLEKLNRPNDAMEAYIKEVAWGDDNQTAWNAASAIYSKDHGGPVGFQAFIRSRANELAVAAAAQSPLDEMNQKISRFELRGSSGPPVQLSHYQGKPVIIDFWATWCVPCVAALQNTQKLVRRFPGKVAVLAVSIDSDETRGSAQKFLADRGFDFTLLFDDEHNRDLQFAGIPTRFLVDPSGRLRIRETGSGPYEDLLFEQRLESFFTARQ